MLERFLIIPILIFAFFLFTERVETPTPATYKSIDQEEIVDVILASSTKPLSTTAKTLIAKTRATTTKPLITPTKTVAMKPIVVPQVVLPPQVPKAPPDFEKINILARSATVNILCTANGNTLSPISGTGVIISSSGAILTNAHVGQYYLLKTYKQRSFVDCVIRTGSPAYPTFNAELLYISPKWVADNKTILKAQNPTSTGENDFALLRITGPIGTNTSPASYPFVPPNTREEILRNEPVLLVSYPAGFLGSLSILQDLNITSAITTVQDYFTFNSGTKDVISVPGTIISQRGSSGGGVIDGNSTIIGIITTSSEGETTVSRGLNALTLGYISRILKSDTGSTLAEFLSENLETSARNFQQNTAPALTKLIIDELMK